MVRLLALGDQAHLARKGARQFGNLPHFDADLSLLADVERHGRAARATAS